MEIRRLQIAIAKDRDELAYKELFIMWYNPAISFSTVITKNDEVSEEIYSDAMMKIWFMEDKLGQIDNLKTYLFVVLKNASLNYLKKSKKAIIVSIDDIDTNQLLSPPAEESLLHDELNELLKRAINSLPPKCLMVYKLIKDEGFSYRQTAEILGLSVNTIEGHMQNALRKISAYLKQTGLMI